MKRNLLRRERADLLLDETLDERLDERGERLDERGEGSPLPPPRDYPLTGSRAGKAWVKLRSVDP